MEIKIYSAKDDTGMYNEKYRYRGTYAHGEIETQLGYDLFCFEHKLELKEGTHHFKIFGKPTTFFLWKGDFHSKWRGFLIYDNDVDYDWAFKKFETRDLFI